MEDPPSSSLRSPSKSESPASKAPKALSSVLNVYLLFPYSFSMFI